MEKQAEQTMDIVREELPMLRFAGAGLSQAVVEGEVALPGGLREETHVLCTEAMAVLERSNAVYIVADFSKFDKTSFINICNRNISLIHLFNPPLW